MAITINKYAAQCVKADNENRVYNEESNPQVYKYRMSAHWRTAMVVDGLTMSDIPDTLVRHAEVARSVVAGICYLQRSGVADIEELLRDVMRKDYRIKI